MNYEELRTTVKDIYHETKEWNAKNPNYYSQIMFDTEDGYVWSRLFTSESDYIIDKDKKNISVPVNQLIYDNADHILSDSEIIDLLTDYIISNCHCKIEH